MKQGAIGTFSSSRTSGGGLFDPDNIDFNNKNNHYLMYFFAKGIFYNQELGKIIAHVLNKDANSSSYWKQILNYDLFGDPSLSLFGPNPRSNNDVIFLQGQIQFRRRPFLLSTPVLSSVLVQVLN